MARHILFETYKRARSTPEDQIQYVIPSSAIRLTERVLLDYAEFETPHEGMVYWGGNKEGNLVQVRTVIAPLTTSHSGSVSTSNQSNVGLVIALTDNNCTYVGQVHSHPGSWVDHSDGDDEWAAFKFEGLLSIVIPVYGKRGMLPLTKCGVHRFQSGRFVRMSNEYITNHIELSTESNVRFMDLRHE